MIKLSKKSLLLFVVAVASMASASSASAVTFDGVGQHTLTSTNLGYDVPGAGASCANSTFEVNVPTGGATATVTTATFSGCVGTGILLGAAHLKGDGFPWEITTLGVTGQGTLDGVSITANFTGPAALVTLEGNLVTPWNNTSHTALFSGQTLTSTSPLGTQVATITGTFRDDQQTLTFT
jgi:hypothetical protein